MLIARQMARLWDARKFDRFLDELLGTRVEAAATADLRQHACIASAALALIRLDELHQGHTPICPKLIRAIISQQDPDGGWGDLILTALCVRALTVNGGAGDAICRALQYLANMQQLSGIWPRVPIRRMPHDAFVSAFILLQLGDNDPFRQAVDISAATEWFESHLYECDPATRNLWSHARLRLAPLHRESNLWELVN
jgi:hypothetical protein